MEIWRARDMGTFVDDDFLNFTLEGGGGGGGEEEEDYKTSLNSKDDAFSSPTSMESSNTKRKIFGSEAQKSFPEAALEEDLEWLSNKDAFPSVETCFGFLSADSEILLEQLSPVSVLDSNSNDNGNCNTGASCFGTLKVPIRHPVGIRSKKRRMTRFGEFLSNQCAWSNKVNVQAKQESLISLQPSIQAMKNTSSAYMGRRCLHCQAEKTPQWRAGPMGPKTLCNACGVRYKSGRLLPEYRPASSPTFSSKFHSNSHRKVVEMRMQRQRGAIV